MAALPLSFVPAARPMRSPPLQITKVTTAMRMVAANASIRWYSEIVNPTESASIEVATPCIASFPSGSFASVSSMPHSSPSGFRMPSSSILPPM